MAAHDSPGGSGLITPLEPRRGRGAATAPAAQPPTEQAVYATPSGRLEAAVASSCGSQHASNEDAHTALTGSGRLFVVADGVGGGAMAQTASRMLVAFLHRALDSGTIDADRIGKAMLGADRAIARAIAEVTDRPGAATVALCAAADAPASKWLVAWVGDCRLYRLAAGADAHLELLTRDDTFRNLGETPPPGGSLDDPARMVGNGATSGANVALHHFAPGDLLALCSDGVHKYVPGADWCLLLAEPAPLARRSADLVAAARANGSVDDATVLLLHRSGAALPGSRWPARNAAGRATGRSER